MKTFDFNQSENNDLFIFLCFETNHEKEKKFLQPKYVQIQEFIDFGKAHPHAE